MSQPSKEPSPALQRALLWLLALTPLLLSAVWIDPSTLHLEGMWSVLNDQVVYIDAARSLLAHGKLEAGVIYPSTLLQDYGRNYMYMPGHASVLAASFWLLGDSPLSATLPSLLGLLLSCLAAWALVKKLWGGVAAQHSARLLLLLPPLVIYALTAMSELTFMATGLGALAAFVHLPRRLRPWLAPALLLPPFLFRETGALWIIPMVALLLRDEEGDLSLKRLPQAGLALGLGVLCLGAIYQLDWVQDRPSLWLQNLYSRNFVGKYMDAYSVTRIQETNPGLVSSILHHAGGNLQALGQALGKFSFEALSLHLALWGPALAAWWAWGRRELRPVALGTLLYHLTLVVLLTLFYKWDTQIGLRQMLPPLVLAALLLGGRLATLEQPGRRALRLGALGALWLLCLGTSLRGSYEVTALDSYQRNLTTFLQSLPLPKDSTVVLSFQFGPTFLYYNPDSYWALPPAGDPTMQLLEDKHDVRALVMTERDISMFIPEAAIHTAGLEAVNSFGEGHLKSFLFLPVGEK
jgi:4-amino-4-deoxy-L-arabinose transferase-like glycosyltransferase